MLLELLLAGHAQDKGSLFRTTVDDANPAIPIIGNAPSFS